MRTNRAVALRTMLSKHVSIFLFCFFKLVDLLLFYVIAIVILTTEISIYTKTNDCTKTQRLGLMSFVIRKWRPISRNRIFSVIFCRLRCRLLKNCHKIGEGVYGEVYLYRKPNGGTSVMKIIPIEGDQIVNGDKQKKFEEIITEIIIAT